jgi:hypothetical protein
VSDRTLTRPDILWLCSEWPERALVRAQLLEEGYEVAAVDAWPVPKLYGTPGMTPRAAIVDLRGLADPRRVLEELPRLVPPDRVLVLTALGTLGEDDVRRLGFRVLARPVRLDELVAAVRALVQRP